jgi:hypothetical protein
MAEQRIDEREKGDGELPNALLLMSLYLAEYRTCYYLVVSFSPLARLRDLLLRAKTGRLIGESSDLGRSDVTHPLPEHENGYSL